MRERTTPAAAPTTPRRRRGFERRQAILDAAVRLFHENGYEGASLREVAAAVGINKASLYYYFESKEKILAAIHDQLMDILFELASARRVQGDPPDVLLVGYLTDGLVMMRDFRSHMEVFLRERHVLTGDLWEQARKRRSEYQAYMYDAVVAAMEEGVFRQDLDPLVVTFALFGMTNWTYQWFDPNGRMSAEEIARQFAEIVLDGVRSRDASRQDTK